MFYDEADFLCGAFSDSRKCLECIHTPNFTLEKQLIIENITCIDVVFVIDVYTHIFEKEVNPLNDLFIIWNVSNGIF